jgi:hypothetical protein
MALQFRDLLYENFLEITDKMDDQTLLTYCSIDKTSYKFCDNNFWLRRVHAQKLDLLLPYHGLYPSLKEFYLNIRNDAIYVLKYYTMKDGRPHHNIRYFTEIAEAYNALLSTRAISLTSEQWIETGKETRIGIDILNHTLHIDESYTIYEDEFIEDTNQQHFDIPILHYPSLTARSVILVAFSKARGGYKRTRINVTTASLRESFRSHYASITLAKIGSMFNPVHMNQFIYGYFSSRRDNNPIMVLLDYGLIPGADTTDYRIVIAPYPPPRILIPARRRKIFNEESEGLLRHLEQHGTFYKFEDLPAAMDLIQ